MALDPRLGNEEFLRLVALALIAEREELAKRHTPPPGWWQELWPMMISSEYADKLLPVIGMPEEHISALVGVAGVPQDAPQTTALPMVLAGWQDVPETALEGSETPAPGRR